MTIREIITVPNPLLKTVSEPVKVIDDEVLSLIDDMIETMYAAPGIGLAAIQVGVPKRILVIDITRDDEAKNPLSFINPEIIDPAEKLNSFEEGCLSVPGVWEEIERPDNSRVPTFFVFDIQEDQVQGLEDLLIKQGFKLENLSPMVRARLSTINGQVYKGQYRFDAIRDRDMERMLRARIHNLSYLSTDQLGDNIVEGSPLLGSYDQSQDKLAQISLEKRWADWREIEVGDRIVFDVAGIPIETEVKNLRKVVWTSFQPAFFILMQQGILEDAPKVFLGSIKNIPIEDRLSLQNKIVQIYPNISVIDVSRLVERIFSVIDKITIAGDSICGQFPPSGLDWGG